MTVIKCLNCDRERTLWRAGDTGGLCICGHNTWVTWRMWVKSKIEAMKF